MIRRRRITPAPKARLPLKSIGRPSGVDKERIIEAAVKLFGEQGYAATSIRDIAGLLDISIATLYYYYTNKEEMLYTIIEEIGEDLRGVVTQAREEAADPLEGLRRMLSAHIHLTEKKGGRVKIYVEEQHVLSREYMKAIYKQHREIYNIYMEQLRLVKKMDVLAIDSPQIIAFAMFGMVNWCYRWFHRRGALTIEQVTEGLIQMIFNGILKPGVPRPMAGPGKR